MSKSRLTQAIVPGALLAAANLATITAVAHAKDGGGPAAIHDHQRPPTQGQVGESWHQPSPAANQSAVAGHRQRPPTEGQVGEPWHLRVRPPAPSTEPDSQPRWPGRIAGRTDRRAGAGRRPCRQASKPETSAPTDRLTPPRSATRWGCRAHRQPHRLAGGGLVL